MKRYINIYILAPVLFITLAMATGCKKFLEEKVVSNLTQEFYNSEAGLNSLVNGLYVYARVKHEWSDCGARIIETETDAYMHQDGEFARMINSRYGGELSTIAGYVNNFLGAANSNFAPMGAYPHINNCNIAMEVIDELKPGKFGADEVYRAARRGEILMLRSWAYYLVSNQLGAVPLLLTAKRQDDGKYYYPKSDLETIYKQIIGDMRYAFENLPAVQGERGRVTKWAAGHFLAKLYLNRAQAAAFQNSGQEHLQRLFKGNVSTDLDSCIYYATQVIDGKGGAGGLAPDFWTLFNPANEGSPHGEILWSAQFDVNGQLNGRFGGNRSCNYHTGNYTDQSGVARAFVYGRPFSTLKPTDWGYDNFRDKVHDSRYYKTFQYEYVGNGPASFPWNDAAAAWWNANNGSEPDVVKNSQGLWPSRVQPGKRAIIYIENQFNEPLDSAEVMSQPHQLLVRWIRSAVTNRIYYRKYIDGSDMGLNTGRRNIYLSSKKFVDPNRTGTNPDSESGTRDAILMRLAETFLVRAEALGRKGMYAEAVNDINVVRRRAAYRGGEIRPLPLVQWEPQRTSLSAAELQTPFAADGSSVTKMEITQDIFTPGTAQATAEGYITGLSKEQMFIHFIYNEKAREFISEGIAWEDQHNAGILYERAINFNQMCSPLSGRWPSGNNATGTGQNGNGKGSFQPYMTFRPWPNAFLVQMTDEEGKPLDAAAMDAYQNTGY